MSPFFAHSPNHVAASDALRLNCDSKNFGPKVDMPAMSVASVAPAKQRKRNVGFFKRSSTDLQKGSRVSSLMLLQLSEVKFLIKDV